MAYSLGDRFLPTPKCYKLFDPGAYEKYPTRSIKQNKAAFLSSATRNTGLCGKIWTHTIYDVKVTSKIPNCRALLSKQPRFKAFTKEDLEEFLCRCGIQTLCECPIEEGKEEDLQCQAKVRRRLYKGAPPHSTLSGGLSAPSKRHRGFEILPDGSIKQIVDEVKDESPPFYDARVNEATAFYHGCKWSKWKSKRSLNSSEVRPGPADYSLEKKLTEAEICMEKLRGHRRKTFKQLRYIEMVQARNILENRPGPATYTPQQSKGTDLTTCGPKAERFPESQLEIRPSPADYSVKRDFDLPDFPEKYCHAKLPDPSCFGIKAQRFKPLKEEGPGPANYFLKSKICDFMHCPRAPFGCSALRFKDKVPFGDNDDEDIEEETENDDETKSECPVLTWGFRSKTVRMKPLVKKLDEPSPADLLVESKVKEKRSELLQYIAPFNSSEGRFQPWYDWMPVFANFATPGPCSYSLEKPKCFPAVSRGPLVRDRRFRDPRYPTPAPNEYKVGRGIETVLATHNNRLKGNMKHQHKFHWKPINEPRKLTFQEQETLLLKKTIALLNVETNEKTVPPRDTSVSSIETTKDKHKKMLRCFLYQKPIPHYF